MGAGPKMPYPKWVWSPAGGWYCNPPNWKRNFAIAMVAYAGITYYVFQLSARNERRPTPPHGAAGIPSQRWAKHAKEDDPRLEKCV